MSNMGLIQQFQQGQKTGTQYDDYDCSLWDTLAFEGGVFKPNYRMFTVPLGGAGNGITNKLFCDTNMKSGGIVPNGKFFVVHAIGVQINEWQSASPTANLFGAVGTFIEQSVLEVKIDGKSDLGAWTLQELMGLQFSDSSYLSASGAGVDILTNQSPNKAYKLNLPIILPALQPFEFLLSICRDTATLATSGKVRIILKGRMKSSM